MPVWHTPGKGSLERGGILLAGNLWHLLEQPVGGTGSEASWESGSWRGTLWGS